MALPSVSSRLEGWALHLAHLSLLTPPEGALDAAIADVLDRLRQRTPEAGLPGLEPVAVVRGLFRRAGTDPTRYRPSSEGLARRVLRGDGFPRIAPVVELRSPDGRQRLLEQGPLVQQAETMMTELVRDLGLEPAEGDANASAS